MPFEIVDKETPDDVSADVIMGYHKVTPRVGELVQQADDILTKDAASDLVAVEARTCRIELMRIRTETERTRKELLKPLDLRRKSISGAAAIITDVVAQREAKLSVIEQAAEDRKEQRRKALHDARYAELAEIVSGDALTAYALVDLGSKSKSEFADILNAARTIAAEIEAKRLADEAEAKRLADEAEAARVEAQRKAELEALQAAQAAEEEKRIAAEAENAALRAQLAEIEQKANAEAAAKRLKDEAEAAEKKRALDEQLRVERERIAAEQALAVAPDREKLTAFIDSLAKLAPPEMATKSGKTTATCLVGILTKARKDMATYVINLR